MPLSYEASRPARVATPVSRDDAWSEINISSASSFEDLGLDLDSEQDQLEGTHYRTDKLIYSAHKPVKRKKPIKKGQAKRQAEASTLGISKGGALSEADTSQVEPNQDFLELLQAARAFGSLRPVQETSRVPSSSSSRNASPAAPASMSSSTNFVLSSSDSPPSRDLTSSREMVRSGSTTRSPSPLPLELEARLHLSREETITGVPRGEPDKPQGWWDWLLSTIGPFGISVTVVSIVGLGLAIASRSSFFRKPTIRMR